MNIIPALSLHLATIQSTILDECDRSLADTDLRGVQLFYLLTVCQNAGMSQDRLAALLGVANSNVTRQISALEGLGYVTRRRDENDGRRCLVDPTDRAYEMLPRLVDILRDAQAVFTGEVAALTETQLSEHMIGRQLKLMNRDTAKNYNKPSLQVEHISMQKKDKTLLTDVSIQIAPGEILGIAGVDGNGQKYLAEAILGIRKYQSGSISLAGKKLDDMDVSARKKLGIGYISDDRHHDGLVIDMSLSENMLLQEATSDTFVRRGFIDRKSVLNATEAAIRKFSIKTPGPSTPIRLLSGGNQQKLILARELYDGVQLIVAFQPTRGLDIGASEFIREQLLHYRQLGCCVLLISADLEEILSISDRVSVMHGGKIMGEFANDSNIDMAKLGLMMAGRTADSLV
jgi:simple sugar transport system ATP-binding protein